MDNRGFTQEDSIPYPYPDDMLGTYWETGSLVKGESYMGETWELKERDDVSFYVSSSAYSPHLLKYPGQ